MGAYTSSTHPQVPPRLSANGEWLRYDEQHIMRVSNILLVRHDTIKTRTRCTKRPPHAHVEQSQLVLFIVGSNKYECSGWACMPQARSANEALLTQLTARQSDAPPATKQ